MGIGSVVYHFWSALKYLSFWTCKIFMALSSILPLLADWTYLSLLFAFYLAGMLPWGVDEPLPAHGRPFPRNCSVFRNARSLTRLLNTVSYLASVHWWVTWHLRFYHHKRRSLHGRRNIFYLILRDFAVLFRCIGRKSCIGGNIMIFTWYLSSKTCCRLTLVEYSVNQPLTSFSL